MASTPIKTLEILVSKRDELLAARPALQQMQAEIDRLLLHAGSAAGREAALDIMLRAKTEQLTEFAKDLEIRPLGICDEDNDA